MTLKISLYCNETLQVCKAYHGGKGHCRIIKKYRNNWLRLYYKKDENHFASYDRNVSISEVWWPITAHQKMNK